VRINYTKSAASGTGNIGEARLMSQIGRVRRSVCFCSLGGGGASIHQLT
jgi:hypothetical protein